MNTEWRLPARVFFVFGAIYLALYNFLAPLQLVPGIALVVGAWERLWARIVPWVGQHLLGLAQPIAAAPNGSGDRTFDYVELFCFAIIALAGALVWSVVERHTRRRDYRKGFEALRIYVRYSLAIHLLGYGMVKVFKSQFPAPGPFRLTETYGESSPMGLLWTFMGASTPYTVFAGLGEVVGGVLLFFRRTTTLGALVSVGVLLNVVMLNLCYDVPVKQFSLHLLAMAVFLAAADFRRLANVLVLNRAAPAAPVEPPFTLGPRATRAIRVAWGLLVVLAVAGTAVTGWHNMVTWGDRAPRHPLQGIYDVFALERDGQPVTAASPPTARWHMVGIDRRTMEFRLGDDTRVMVGIAETDERARRLTVVRRQDSGEDRFQIGYELDRDGLGLTLRGRFGPEAVVARLQRRPESSFVLLSRGFRWVSEFPYNR